MYNITTRLYGVSQKNSYIIPSKPSSDVHCFKFNFILLNMGYYTSVTENIA